MFTIGDCIVPSKKIPNIGKIVGVLKVCESSVCVIKHAVQMYRARLRDSTGDLVQSTEVILQMIYDHLIIADYTVRHMNTSFIIKHGWRKGVYRYHDGWVFVLVWNIKLNAWVLKTCYLLDDEEKAKFQILSLSLTQRILSWDREYEPPKVRLTRKQKRHKRSTRRYFSKIAF